MNNSSERILTTHVGSLVRPPEIRDLVQTKETGHNFDSEELAGRVASAVVEVVRRPALPIDSPYCSP